MTKSASTEPLVKSTGDRALEGPISTKPLLSKRARVTTAIVSAIVLLVVVAVLVGLGYLMYTSYDRAGDAVPGTVRLRDMSFIVLAVETMVVMILLLIITVLLAVIIVMAYDRVIPILEQINRAVGEAADTVQNVRGTTAFIGEKVVSPMIEVSSYASGVRKVLKGILDLWPGRK